MERIGQAVERATGTAFARGSQQLSRTSLPPDLVPMDPKALMVKLAQTLAIWKLPDDWDEVGVFYREAFADVPADLVDIALRHVRLTLKWFPKPCELREPIARMLQERQQRHAREVQRQGHITRQLAEREEWQASWPAAISEDDRADHDTGRVLTAEEVHEGYLRAHPESAPA